MNKIKIKKMQLVEKRKVTASPLSLIKINSLYIHGISLVCLSNDHLNVYIMLMLQSFHLHPTAGLFLSHKHALVCSHSVICNALVKEFQ